MNQNLYHGQVPPGGPNGYNGQIPPGWPNGYNGQIPPGWPNGYNGQIPPGGPNGFSGQIPPGGPDSYSGQVPVFYPNGYRAPDPAAQPPVSDASSPDTPEGQTGELQAPDAGQEQAGPAAQPPVNGPYPYNNQPPVNGQYPYNNQPPVGGPYPYNNQPPVNGPYPYNNQPPVGGPYPYYQQPPVYGPAPYVRGQQGVYPYYGRNVVTWVPYGPAPRRNPYASRLLPRERQLTCQRELFSISSILGAGFLLFQILRLVFSRLVGLSESFYALYSTNLNAMYLTDILFTLICVGLPFLFVWLFLKRKRREKVDLEPEIPGSAPQGLRRFFDRARVSAQIPLGRVYKSGETALLVFAALGVCLLTSIAVNYVLIFANALGFRFYSTELLEEALPVPEGAVGILLFFVRTAILPAIIEELCFRGVVLQSLRRFGDWFAIAVSAILFGLTHGNMIQAPFAIVAGFAMGYAAVVTGSLRTSIAIHLLNNGAACLSQIIVGNADSVTAMVSAAGITYGLIFVGIVCGIIYLVRKKNAFRLRQGDYPFAKKRMRYCFFSPAMLAAVIWFLIQVLGDIHFVGLSSGLPGLPG